MNSQDRRIRECLEIHRGEPLDRKPVQETPWAGRPAIARYMTTSIVNFALRVFINGEEEYYDVANTNLYENARYYREHKNVRDDRDSYYWQLGEQIRILYHYGRFGDRKSGLLRDETELEMVHMMAEYLYDNCRMDFFEYEVSRTWKIHESENHHLQRANAYRMQAMMVQKYPEYGDMMCGDGHRLSEHLKASTRFLKEWICERGRKSLLVECASPLYSKQCLKEAYHLYDITEDMELRSLAGQLLDLYFATVAQEHLNGCRGGGPARVYPWCYRSGFTAFHVGHYCALGIGRPAPLDENDYTPLDSDYRCPELIRRMAQDPEMRGTYEIFSRPAGLADAQNHYPDYSAEKGYGGIVRYSYCTPHFIMGTPHFHRRPNHDWLAISSQNRVQGINFGSDRDARIVPVPRPNPKPERDRVSMGTAYNHWFSAQKEGCLITMPMPEEYTVHGGEPMSIWVSSPGELADHLEEKGGWIFTHTVGAYVAIYAAGEYEIDPDCMERNSFDQLRPMGSGAQIRCKTGDAAVVIEAADREMYPTYAAFVDAVLANHKPKVEAEVLSYRSLQGHEFIFGLGKDDGATIDGADPAAEIRESYKSPFLNGIWGEPTVELRYAGETITWDFSVKEE